MKTFLIAVVMLLIKDEEKSFQNDTNVTLIP